MTLTKGIPAITVRGLCKSYGGTVVLDGIDLEVAQGTVFALLGPNGAGKTTTVHILSTLIPADAGEVLIAGHDLVSDADLVERFDIVEAARKPALTYSGGMLRRLDLAMSLVCDPRIVFLDEPTVGLDPRSRRGMWQIIRELLAGGITIFLTTQYLEEADHLAGRIALLDEGRLVVEGTPNELKRLVPGGHVTLRFSDIEQLSRAAQALGESRRDDNALTVDVPSTGGVKTLRALLDQLDRSSVEVEDVAIHRADLDDVFLALTGRRSGEKEDVA